MVHAFGDSEHEADYCTSPEPKKPRFRQFGMPTTFVYHRRWSMIDLRRLVCLDCGYTTSELPR